MEMYNGSKNIKISSYNEKFMKKKLEIEHHTNYTTPWPLSGFDLELHGCGRVYIYIYGILNTKRSIDFYYDVLVPCKEWTAPRRGVHIAVSAL